MSLTIEEARECAHRGVALMDRIEPGWRDKVNPNELQIISSGRCVLGQVYGSYGAGLDAVADHEGACLTALGSTHHGFAAPSPEEFTGDPVRWSTELSRRYVTLDTAWRGELVSA